ncbi:MAG TPA: hypothetical protein VLW85_14115, partial [Myxococcales bacterium]|nr:hypothetical protein [Myxococcales bacterium]
MQLEQDILGGLASGGTPPTRRQRLAEEGRRAQAEIARLIADARSRARRVVAARLLSLFAAAALAAVLLAAMIASVDGTLLARSVGGALLAAAAALLLWKRPRTADPRQIARLLGGPSELLSSVELSQEQPAGASLELLSLLHIRAASAARKIDPARAIPASSLKWPVAALAGAALLWIALSLLAPRHVSQGLLRLWSGDEAVPPVAPSPIAGDLSITYLYPAYTGLPPRTEEGTAGDLRAPKGTEVRLTARADRDLEQAFAVVNGAAVKLDA